MGILAFLQSGLGFLFKPVKFGGGGPLLVWLMAIYGAYSMVSGGYDGITRMLGVNKDQIIAQQDATIKTYGNANSELENTVKIAVDTQESTTKVLTDAYEEVTDVKTNLDSIRKRREEALEEIDSIIPIIPYDVDEELASNTETATVAPKQEQPDKPTVNTDEQKEVKLTVVSAKEDAKIVRVSKPKKPKETQQSDDSYYKVDMQKSREAAKINIDALWSAYEVVVKNSGVET